ncbi:MAG: type I glyceraldehyde-3-phosphate dehydrogenase [Patescibacteria group bacterium]
MINIAINGFGRIGRTTLKAGWNNKNVRFVAVNDLTEPRILAHLLQYDSVFSKWEHKVEFDAHNIIIDKKKIPVYTEKEPSKLPWKKHKVDVVIESTGRFRELKDASMHLAAGAKYVVISAPSKDAPTHVMGVNHMAIGKKDKVINNASCTTNCVAPITQIMKEAFGVEKAMLTTVHATTMEQNIIDGLPPKLKPNDLRAARSALVNIVPTSTGAAIATTQAVDGLGGKFDGVSIRVPMVDVSLSDVTFLLSRNVTVEEVNNAFIKASKTKRWKGILDVTDLPLVSSDFIGNPHLAIVDLDMTRVVNGDLVKVMAWYDNEWGYSFHLIEMAENIAKKK